MDKLDEIEQDYMKEDINDFDVGDTVEVHVLIDEGGTERIQKFEGDVIRRRGSGLNETFTVRHLVQGEGVERTFPVHSPRIEKVVPVRSTDVRRSRLYYLRDREGKAARLRRSGSENQTAATGDEEENGSEQ